MEKIIINGSEEMDIKDIFISSFEMVKETIDFENENVKILLATFYPGELKVLNEHKEIIITFVRSGLGKFLIDNEERVITPGDMIITMSNIKYDLEVLGNEPLSVAELLILK